MATKLTENTQTELKDSLNKEKTLCLDSVLSSFVYDASVEAFGSKWEIIDESGCNFMLVKE